MGFLFIIKESIFPLVTVLAISYIYAKKLSPDIPSLNNIVLILFTPIFTFYKVLQSGYGIKDITPVFIYVFIYTAIMAAASTILSRKMNEEKSIPFIANATFMNFGNVGMPLILFAFNKDVYKEAVILWIAFNIPLSTYAIWLYSVHKDIKSITKNIIKIPIFPAFILAVAMNELSVALPPMIDKPIGFISDAALPVMTILFGFALSQVSYKPGFLKYISVSLIIRLIIGPIVGVAIAYALNMPLYTAKAAVVMAATPMAVTPVMYAISFKRDYELSASLVFATTAVSIITMPLVILLAEKFM